MVFADNLYLSPDVKEKYRKHIRALQFNRPSFLLYVAVFLEGERQLALVHNAIFLSNYKDSDAFIVGLALGKKEGMKLLGNILEDTYKKRKDFDCYSFLRELERA